MEFNNKTVLRIWGVAGILMVAIMILGLGSVLNINVVQKVFAQAPAAECVNVPQFNNAGKKEHTSITRSLGWQGYADEIEDGFGFSTQTFYCDAGEYVCGLRNGVYDCNGNKNDCFYVIPICCTTN